MFIGVTPAYRVRKRHPPPPCRRQRRMFENRIGDIGIACAVGRSGALLGCRAIRGLTGVGTRLNNRAALLTLHRGATGVPDVRARVARLAAAGAGIALGHGQTSLYRCCVYVPAFDARSRLDRILEIGPF